MELKNKITLKYIFIRLCIFSASVLVIFMMITCREKKVFRQLKYEVKCFPKSNIAFLKTHKCASSSIQNMLFRYGEKNSLTFALPDYGNYFGGKDGSTFKASMVSTTPWNRPFVNIYTIHTKWNITEMEKLMPNDTVFFTIVREPSEAFESLFSYTKMEQMASMNLTQYVTNVTALEHRHQGYLGYNQMAYDFGLPKKSFNKESLHKMLKASDKHFSLVMVADRMEESLILLKEILCWEMEDILLLKTNSRASDYKMKMDLNIRIKLQNRLHLDYIIYDHYVTRFNKAVKKFGQERMKEEVEKLRKEVEKLVEKCQLVEQDPEDANGPNKPFSDKVKGLETQSTDGVCRSLVRSELKFIHLLLTRQKLQRLGPQALANDLPLGATQLRNANLTDVIENLKRSGVKHSHT